MDTLKSLVLTGVCSAFVSVVSAQGVSEEPDAMKSVTPEEDPRVISLYYDYFSEVDFDNEAGGYSMHTSRLKTPLAGKGGESFAWVVNAFVEHTVFDVKGQPLLADDDLYRVGAEINLFWPSYKGSKWSPVVRLAPSLASDFESVTSDDFKMNAFVGSFYRPCDNLQWLFGVFYSDSVNDSLIVPGIGFSWQPTDQLDVTLLGPRLDAMYTVSDDLRLGVFASANSRTWDVEGSSGSESLEVASARAGVRVDYQVVEDCWLVIEAGSTFSNNVELLDESDNVLFDDEADSGFFGKIGLRYRF